MDIGLHYKIVFKSVLPVVKVMFTLKNCLRINYVMVSAAVVWVSCNFSWCLAGKQKGKKRHRQPAGKGIMHTETLRHRDVESSCSSYYSSLCFFIPYSSSFFQKITSNFHIVVMFGYLPFLSYFCCVFSVIYFFHSPFPLHFYVIFLHFVFISLLHPSSFFLLLPPSSFFLHIFYSSSFFFFFFIFFCCGLFIWMAVRNILAKWFSYAFWLFLLVVVCFHFCWFSETQTSCLLTHRHFLLNC